jgi:hypothetical protein
MAQDGCLSRPLLSLNIAYVCVANYASVQTIIIAFTVNTYWYIYMIYTHVCIQVLCVYVFYAFCAFFVFVYVYVHKTGQSNIFFARQQMGDHKTANEQFPTVRHV